MITKEVKSAEFFIILKFHLVSWNQIILMPFTKLYVFLDTFIVCWMWNKSTNAIYHSLLYYPDLMLAYLSYQDAFTTCLAEALENHLNISSIYTILVNSFLFLLYLIMPELAYIIEHCTLLLWRTLKHILDQ